MKFGALAAAFVLVFMGCGSDPKAVTNDNFRNAIVADFMKNPTHAKLCVPALQTPYEMVPSPTNLVPEKAAPFDAVARAQYDALASVGLLTAARKSAPALDRIYPRHMTSVPVNEYRQTALGVSNTSGATPGQFGSPGSLCYAMLGVDAVQNWTEPGDLLGQRLTEVSYQPKLVDVAAWARNPKVEAAFPQIAESLATIGKTPRKIDLHLTNLGWESM